MRFRSRLRSSSALWAAPFSLAIPVLYYLTGASRPAPPVLDDAAVVISAPLYYSYALAYAVTSALAAWESGRLKEWGVRDRASARSRFRVAAEVLWPVTLLGWLVVLVPVVMALVDHGVRPTETGLRPVWLALLLCAAHAVIGFAVGRLLPKVVAAPVMAIVVWVAVSFPVSFETAWPRHVSGAFLTDLMFGEAATYRALLPHLLLTGSIAAGLALCWVRIPHAVLRTGLAVCLAAAGTTSAYAMTHSWGYDPPLLVDQAPEVCSGSAPRVCVPRALGGGLRPADQAVRRVLKDFDEAGVRLAPRLVEDDVTQGRAAGSRPSTQDTWRPSLTAGVRAGHPRYVVAMEAVTPPCARPDRRHLMAAQLWAARVTGTDRELRADLDRRRQGDPEEAAVQDRAEAEFRAARRLPAASQPEWYRHELRLACGAGR